MKKRSLYAAGVCLMMFMAAACTTTQGVLLTDYIEYYGLESSAQGTLSSFQSIGNCAALFIIGYLLRKLDKRVLLLVTAVVIPCVFIMFGFRPVYGAMLAGYLIYGMVFAFLDSLSSSVMVDLYPENSSMYMNLLHGIYGLGGLVGPAASGILSAAGLAWSDVLFVFGLCALVVAGIFIAITAMTTELKNAGADESGAAESRGISAADMAGFLKPAGRKIFILSAFFYGAHQVAITTWMTRYISDYLFEPRGAVVLSVFWVCVAASRLFFPHVFRKNINLTIPAGHFVCAAAMLAGILSGNGFLMIVCVGISGLAEGMILPLMLDIACHMDLQRTTLGSSVVLLALYLGFIVTPVVMGWLISVASVTVGMMTAAVTSAAAGGLMMCFLGDARREDEDCS